MSTMQMFPLFSIPFAKINLSSEIEQSDIDAVLAYADNKEVLDKSVMNLISTNSYVLNSGLSKNSKLKNLMKEHIQFFLSTVLGEQSAELKITQSWINVTPPGDAHHRHKHTNSIISGVLFFRVPSQSGKFVIEKPEYQLSSIRNFATAETNYNNDYYEFVPDNFELCLFPSYLPHYVTKNESNFDRVSLSFNTFYTGEINTDHERGRNSLSYLYFE